MHLIFFFIFSFIVICTLYFIKFYGQYNIPSYEIGEIQSVTWNWKTNLNVQCIWFSFLFWILIVWILNFIMYFILLEKYTTHLNKGIKINSTNVLCYVSIILVIPPLILSLCLLLLLLFPYCAHIVVSVPHKKTLF